MTTVVRSTTSSLAGLLDTLEAAGTVLTPLDARTGSVDAAAGRIASRVAAAFEAHVAVGGGLDAAVDATGADVVVVAGDPARQPDVDELLEALLGRHPRLRVVQVRPDGSCQVARLRRRWRPSKMP